MESQRIIYADRPFFHPATMWLEGTMDVVDDDGRVVVTLPSGEVLSIQPDGSYGTRPAGTTGPYEVARQVGEKLVFHPVVDATYVVPIVVLP
jgi:hypothetical protein